jgi:hypothetical protein
MSALHSEADLAQAREHVRQGRHVQRFRRVKGETVVSASHATLCAKLEPNAGSWRIFASLCGLCLGQSWLG